MSQGFEDILRELPMAVAWMDVVDFNHVDERVAAVGALLDHTVGVHRDQLQWLPPDDPPTESERLAWAWIVRPDLSLEISARASEELREAIKGYRSRERG